MQREIGSLSFKLDLIEFERKSRAEFLHFFFVADPIVLLIGSGALFHSLEASPMHVFEVLFSLKLPLAFPLDVLPLSMSMRAGSLFG